MHHPQSIDHRHPWSAPNKSYWNSSSARSRIEGSRCSWGLGGLETTGLEIGHATFDEGGGGGGTRGGKDENRKLLVIPSQINFYFLGDHLLLPISSWSLDFFAQVSFQGVCTWRLLAKGQDFLNRVDEDCLYDPMYHITRTNCSNYLWALTDPRGICVEGE